MRVELKSPCKVNFILNILGRRPDGFHELETLMHPIPVFDTISCWKAAAGISLTCDNPELPTGPENLVFRAAEKFLNRSKITEGVALNLEKRIPLAAGLGGGSGNAAVTLLALNELFDYPIAQADLEKMAAELGSDVPFFLQREPALATGRGEEVQPIGSFPGLARRAVMLIHPGFGVSTPWAYKNLARFPGAMHGEPGRAARLAKSLKVSLLESKRDFYNSLEAPVLEKFPILRMFQEFLLENGAMVALMSGSGSTTFALADSLPAAETLKEKFHSHFGKSCWVCCVPLE